MFGRSWSAAIGRPDAGKVKAKCLARRAHCDFVRSECQAEADGKKPVVPESNHLGPVVNSSPILKFEYPILVVVHCDRPDGNRVACRIDSLVFNQLSRCR